jgi:Transposase DDE domain
MTPQPPLYQWIDRVTSHFPHLSRPQATVLALWSFGMVLARSCALTAVAVALAPLLGHKDATLRQRLREWYQDAAAKRGRCRAQLDPTCCFAGLLSWITADWPCPRLALALDATTLADRLTVLALSVVYRGCAVPVAWTVLRGNTPEAWNPHWQRMLGLVRPHLPAAWLVVVLSDRGLESKTLFEAIVALGWHPLMRVKAVGHFRPAGWRRFVPMTRFAPRVGRRWRGCGEAYKRATARLHCTLLACWEPGHEHAWLLLTDLPPQAARPAWYAFRSWIEQGFKVIKGAGWQWQQTRMTDPARVARHWLALAVATLWLVQVGGAAESEVAAETLPAVPGGGAAGRGRRLHRIFRRGLAVILAGLVQGQALPHGRFLPEDWPDAVPPDDIWTEDSIDQAPYLPQ